MGFTINEIVSILNGELYKQMTYDKSLIINNFEYSPLSLKQNNTKGLCFISISKERWDKEHRKDTKWRNGNEVALELKENYDLLITEEPIAALTDKVQIIVENSFQVLQQLAKAAREKMSNTVIAITGSVGKSSTRLLMEHVLEENHNIVATRGNHNTQSGVPLYTMKLCDNPDIGILEISLNALNNRGNHSLIVQPDVAIVTSIGEAHLSTLHTTVNIAKFKARIFAGLKQDGLAIINGEIDEPELQILIDAAKKRTNNIKFYSMKNEKVDLSLQSIQHEKNS